MPRKKRCHPAPLAWSSDGSLLVSLSVVADTDLLEEVLAAAKSARGRIFVGVALDSDEAAGVIERLDEAAAEVTAQLVGAKRRRR